MTSIEDLKEFELFKGLSDSELAKLAELCHERTLNEGDRIIEEGTRAAELRLCRSGKIDIVLQVGKPWNTSVTVHRVQAGEVFGWSAVVAPYIYTASAECVEAGQEIYFKGWELLELFDRNPRMGYVFMGNLSAEVSARLMQTRQRLSTDWLTSATPSVVGSAAWGEPRRR